ncbi:LOW QUALITY PROTEIN: probable serine/threonine-protein kinase At1g54610 [Oryza brachyantha]|uniref:LOW QUALITY PROTEIN: probable serine/threonine-protein kinase At1g54610 n=1 Tax=Oryza brachyantha TaxID=4533 RepID=UPI0007766439|nr:LOW QUALITY PROTEIN: probable serine/threonine-protein kinase At1g54610 [Oryza brachyantha]
MKIFTRKPLQSLIHIQFLRSSGRALHGLIDQLCSKCTKHDDGVTLQSETTSSKCKCVYRFFTPSIKGDTAGIHNAPGNGGNTEVLTIQSKENGPISSNILDDGEKSVLSLDPSRKLSAHHRLKIWISSGQSGIIGRYGKKLELYFADVSKELRSEHVNTLWPDWLVNVAPEAVQGWVPLRAESFERLSKIGQGTYSSVYKARDLKTGKFVALKKVRFASVDPESVRFMAREICILRKLNHPNVIKLEGIIASSASQSLYLVFEYMEHDLVGLAATPGLKFTEPQVKCLLQQLLSGLDHCHSNGVLHRDLKGSNLLIDDNGVLKIADFGLATSYDPNSQQPLTSRVATLWYRPPELLLGSTKYGVSVDMWSTGCILAELLSGKPIMPGRTEVEQIHKIFKLCGSPSDEYWQKLNVPQTGMFKPSRQYRRCIAAHFKDFPQPAILLLDNLLSLEPEARGTAASILQSDFFRTKPLACSPSTLPKCPPSKEYDARLRLEEARRQRKVEGSKSVRPGRENPRTNRGNGPIRPKKHTYNSANLNPGADPRALATGVQSPGHDSTWNNKGSALTIGKYLGANTVLCRRQIPLS